MVEDGGGGVVEDGGGDDVAGLQPLGQRKPLIVCPTTTPFAVEVHHGVSSVIVGRFVKVMDEGVKVLVLEVGCGSPGGEPLGTGDGVAPAKIVKASKAKDQQVPS